MPKILIADDSDDTRAFLKNALTVHGWTVCGEASNGRQAVLRAAELKPDLIVLDFSMPMLNGVEAAREILRVTPGVAIVFFTLHKNAQLDAEALRVGVRKVVSKADGLPALLAGIDELFSPANPPVGPLGIVPEQKVAAPAAIVEPSVGPLAAAAPAEPSTSASAAEIPTDSPPKPQN